MLGSEVADAASEGEAGDPGGADHAAGRDEAMRLGGRVEVEPGGAALGAGQARVRIDLDVPHPRQVDHQTVVDGAVPGGVVAAAADGDLQVVLLSEDQRRRHVGGVDAAGDRRRPPVDQQVEAPAPPLVLAVRRREHVAAQRGAELGETVGHRNWRPHHTRELIAW